MLGAGRVPVPALDGDDPVLVGLHAFPRDHVEARLRQRQQRLAVLGKQVRLATSLAVVVLVAQREAPFKQPDIKRRHAPHARHRHEQLAAHRADPGLHAALLVARVRVAEHVLEPVMRLERLEQARQPHPLEHPAPHARGVIEHDPRRHAAQPLEDVAKRLARALSVLPGHKLARADVRIREIQHEMTHTRHLAPEPDVDPARNRPAPRPDATPGRGSRPRAPRRTRAAAARPSSSRSTATPPPRTRHADAPISGSRYAAACATCSDPPRATARITGT